MLLRFLLLALRCVGAHQGFADDGYRLWLNYDQLPEAGVRKAWQAQAKDISLEDNSGSTLQTAANELQLGLAKGGGPLLGFAVAGPDKKFVWAQARIEGNKVVVWNDQVPTPTVVRYAWADDPEAANLYNKESLPASTFTTENQPQ
ncbi:MAG: hypothetical protein H7Z21_13435 [Hymenobacter sp.]|nr:hypothetical protein [Hymenobacter sp.]